jgi:hypothetical protein
MFRIAPTTPSGAVKYESGVMQRRLKTVDKAMGKIEQR